MINTTMFMHRFLKDFENKNTSVSISRAHELWCICKLYEECLDTVHDDRFYNEADRIKIVAKARFKIEQRCKQFLECEYKRG